MKLIFYLFPFLRRMEMKRKGRIFLKNFPYKEDYQTLVDALEIELFFIEVEEFIEKIYIN